MKNRSLTVIALTISLCAGLLTPHAAQAQVPGIINYQGRIVDNGTNFNGTGSFQFALVNGNAGTTNYWSNDGTPVGQPSHTVSLTVSKGLYSVLLGDTTIANMTVAIAPTMFSKTDVRLRVWFNDGVSGFKQLSPDQRVAAAGYAFNAAMAQTAVNIVPTSDVTGRQLNIGVGNLLNGTLATIGGGSNNTASADYATMGGGQDNMIQTNAQYSTIGGGGGNAIQTNAYDSTISGGFQNTIQAYDEDSTIGGGSANTVQANAYDSTIGGGFENTIQANASDSTIGGGFVNTVQGNAYHSTIGGGVLNIIQTNAAESTIGGGVEDTIQAYAYDSTIGGGFRNTILAYDQDSTIGGGVLNTIQTNASDSTIGGGYENSVAASYATVPGGMHNTAGGTASFAAGNSALATNDGAFVWADDTGASFASTSNNQFNVRAAGGVRFYSNAGATTGVILPPGSGSWNSASDRNLKSHFAAVNAEAILQALVAIPVNSWNYKAQDVHIHHIGPMAQDFHAAFGVGEDDRHISEVDAQGVAFAAIQGLNQKLEEQVKDKESEIRELRGRMEQMEKRLEKVSEQVDGALGEHALTAAANVREQGGM